MNLPEYYHYLQQLPLQHLALLQQRVSQQNVTRPAAHKKKLTRKTFLPTRKP